MTKQNTCPVCNTLFTVPPTRPNQKYCSIPCSVLGRKLIKEDSAADRVDVFIERLPDMKIYDVLDGKLRSESATDNYINAKGVRSWQGKKFLVLVVD